MLECGERPSVTIQTLRWMVVSRHPGYLDGNMGPLALAPPSLCEIMDPPYC